MPCCFPPFWNDIMHNHVFWCVLLNHHLVILSNYKLTIICNTLGSECDSCQAAKSCERMLIAVQTTTSHFTCQCGHCQTSDRPGSLKCTHTMTVTTQYTNHLCSVSCFGQFIIWPKTLACKFMCLTDVDWMKQIKVLDLDSSKCHRDTGHGSRYADTQNLHFYLAGNVKWLSFYLSKALAMFRENRHVYLVCHVTMMMMMVWPSLQHCREIYFESWFIIYETDSVIILLLVVAFE